MDMVKFVCVCACARAHAHVPSRVHAYAHFQLMM